MLDVFPLSYGFLVPQCLHTVTVLSTNLFPSSLYLTGKPKCSHTGDLNGAGHSSSSAHHDHAVCGLNMRTTFFFHKSIRGSRVCRTEDIDPNGSRINDDPLHHYLRLLHFCSKSISQSVLALKPAPKSEKR